MSVLMLFPVMSRKDKVLFATMRAHNLFILAEYSRERTYSFHFLQDNPMIMVVAKIVWRP